MGSCAVMREQWMIVYLLLLLERHGTFCCSWQVGDQLLEVNGIDFTNVIHSDAANALRYVVSITLSSQR